MSANVICMLMYLLGVWIMYNFECTRVGLCVHVTAVGRLVTTSAEVCIPTMLPPTVLLVSHCPDCYFASFWVVMTSQSPIKGSKIAIWAVPDYHTVLFHKHPCTVHTNALTFLLSRSTHTHTHTYLHVCMHVWVQ